mgnify:CR=1 FL=1
MGIISKFGNWIFGMFVPKVPHIQIPRPGVSPAEPALQQSLSAREGAVLVKEEGVAVLYPPMGTSGVDERITDTLDFLRHALQRADWMSEWYALREEFDEEWEEEEDSSPVFTVLDGGLADKPIAPEPGPFARQASKDHPEGE